MPGNKRPSQPPLKRSPALHTLVAALLVSAGALLMLLPTDAAARASADDTPPNTSVRSSPSSSTNETAASFSFVSTEPEGATFGCSLDGGAFLPCGSPKTYTDLAEGGHRFRVRAVDAAGNADPTPSARSWTVDLTPPDTSPLSAPRNETTDTTARFEFAADEPVSGFYCSLDGATPTRCTSPKAYTGLSAGEHTFTVRVRDRAGNADPTPGAATWTVVEDRAPVVTIEGAPRIESYHEYHYFEFSADVPGSSFRCALDEEPFAACVSGVYRHVPYGGHTFAVYAVSPGGARGATAVAEYESRDPNWD